MKKIWRDWVSPDLPFTATHHPLQPSRHILFPCLRFAIPRRPDYLALAAYCDGLPPAIFTTVPDPAAIRGVPTVDLTIHFRADLDRIRLPHDTWCLVHFRTHCAAEGFIEEDGEVWSPDGTLLAQSRQLAVLM